MTDRTIVHGTFVIEREYPASPARVFAAFADPATKRRWFVAGKGTEIDEFTMDFRVGGRESTRFRFTGGAAAPPGAPPNGSPMRNDTTYLDIVPERRIVFAYTMALGDKRFSASLSTVDLRASGGGTRLVFTEQAAFLDGGDGPKLREEGWRGLFSRLDEELRAVPAAT
jgi:uncharacterized protein YndB with AHSA1/START domain